MEYIKVDGFEKLYKVSKSGDVYSIKSKKYLKQRIRNGYKTAYLYNGLTKKSKTATVSRLVALTFIDKPANKNIVNHINGNKFDNKVQNLEWTTQKRNVEHALEEKLTIPSTRSVIKLDKDGKELKVFNSIKEAAEDINLTRHSITRVCNGKNKTAGGFKWKYKDATSKTNESMKKIDNYDYMVTKSGNVYSIKTKRILKPMQNANGYQYVTLCKNKEKRNHYIHQLVATAYIQNPEKKKYVNHKNKKKNDNTVKNLEWVTHSENVKHYYSTKSS